MFYLGFETTDSSFVCFHVKSISDPSEDFTSFVKKHYSSQSRLQKLTMSAPVIQLGETLSTSILDAGHEVISFTRKDLQHGRCELPFDTTVMLFMLDGRWVNFRTEDAAFAWEPTNEVPITFSELDLRHYKVAKIQNNRITTLPQPQRDGEDFFWVAFPLDSSYRSNQRMFLLLPLSEKEHTELTTTGNLSFRDLRRRSPFYHTVLTPDTEHSLFSDSAPDSLPVLQQHQTWKKLFPKHLLFSAAYGDERSCFRPKDTSYDQWITYHLDPLIDRLASGVALGICRGEDFSPENEEYREIRELYQYLRGFRAKRVSRMEPLLEKTGGKSYGTFN